MTRSTRILSILGGYAAAVLAALAAVGWRQLNTSGPGARASAGVSAFGDALLAVFSPSPGPRWRCVVAAALEAGTAVIALVR